MISQLPWLTERLYRLLTGVPVNMLLGVRTEGDSESGVKGVDGAVALWEMLIGGGPLGNVAWEKDALDTRLTWRKKRTENKAVKSAKCWCNYKQNTIYFNWRKQLWQVLTGCAAGLGSEDFRWAIIACSRSLSFFSCVKTKGKNRSLWMVNSVLHDNVKFGVETTSFQASWEV